MLNKSLIIEALNCQIESLSEKRFDNFFKIKSLLKEIGKIENPKTSYELLREGGAWLGAVRNWIKCKCFNGEHVTWGSDDYLKMKSMTVRDFETLASVIAAAAIKYN